MAKNLKIIPGLLEISLSLVKSKVHIRKVIFAKAFQITRLWVSWDNWYEWKLETEILWPMRGFTLPSFMLRLGITSRETLCLLGEFLSKPMRSFDQVTLTNQKTGACHPGVLSSMLRWWHLALCLFLRFLSPFFSHQPIRGLWCGLLTNEKTWPMWFKWWEDQGATMTGGAQVGWGDLNRRRENRERRGNTWPWHEGASRTQFCQF